MNNAPQRKTAGSGTTDDPLALTTEDWGKICSLHWPDGLRHVIAELFKRKGHGFGDELFTGGYRMKHVNEIFIRAKLPYRLRGDSTRKRPERDGFDAAVMQCYYELQRISC